MIEEPRNQSEKQEMHFEAGQLVVVRADIPAAVQEALGSLVVPGQRLEIVRVIAHDDEGGNAAWVRPLGSTKEPFAIKASFLAYVPS